MTRLRDVVVGCFVPIFFILLVTVIVLAVYRSGWYDRPPLEDPTTRVWTDREKSINCWYVREPRMLDRVPEVQCVPIMEVNGHYEETR